MAEIIMENGIYTFCNFCIDFKYISSDKATPSTLRVMWDIYGDDYKKYCRSQKLCREYYV